jgi:hypothetical protein
MPTPTPRCSFRSTLPLLTALALAPATPAQAVFPAGTALRAVANSFTRGGAGMGAGELLQRFDADELQGYGVEAAFPGVQVVRGVVVQARDFGSSTPSGLFDVTLYGEDPLRPGFPDLAHALATATGISGSSIPLTYTAVPFPVPALVPPGVDLFVGIRVNATTSQFGGVRLNVLWGTPQATSPHDLAGAALPTSPPEQNSHRLFRDLTTGTLTYLSRGQYMLDLLTTAPGGFPTAITNQPHYPISLGAPGATTMLSALHPDASSPPQHAGRADDVGFLYRDPALPVGSLVAFVGAFADFGPLVPLATYVPGSLGGTCLDAGAAFVLGFATTNAGFDAWWTTPVPAGARPVLHGVAWTQQAIGFDAGTDTLRGTQCGKQVF